jgi:carboxyl-terminal processing protease
MSLRSRTLIALLTGVAIGFSGALASNVFADRQEEGAGAHSPAALPWEGAHLLAEAFARIKRDYVDEVDDQRLLENAVRGMVAGLDPHSAFLDTQEFEEMRLSTMGTYPGVGIEVAADGSAVRILHIIEGSPAERAGLRSGDLIAKIDAVDVGADVSGAIARMRGEAGTTVTLTVRRPTTGELRDYTLQRAHVEVHSVRSELLQPGYGYLRITGFSETTPQDLEHAVTALKHANQGPLKGLVLDLRNNPGGVLESGVAVADAFLEHGVIVTADGRTPDARFRMDATPGDVIGGAPLVVLVNGGSASAAEIVAGALKDHARAELIGHRTYGKGSVQTVMPLSKGAIKLTTSRYFTPSGTSIQERGILPDLTLEDREQPPAEMGPEDGSEPLLPRDAEVRVALRIVKERLHQAQAGHLTVAAAAYTSAPEP